MVSMEAAVLEAEQEVVVAMEVDPGVVGGEEGWGGRSILCLTILSKYMY